MGRPNLFCCFNIHMKLKALSLFQLKQKDILLSVAGGVNKNNVSDYAKLGIRLFITSAPYYAPPEDIKVVIEKI